MHEIYGFIDAAEAGDSYDTTAIEITINSFRASLFQKPRLFLQGFGNFCYLYTIQFMDEDNNPRSNIILHFPEKDIAVVYDRNTGDTTALDHTRIIWRK